MRFGPTSTLVGPKKLVVGPGKHDVHAETVLVHLFTPRKLCWHMQKNMGCEVSPNSGPP